MFNLSEKWSEIEYENNMCVSVNQCLCICTHLHLNVSVCCIKWVFDHGPQSDRSQVLQIVWCTKNGKVMFKYIENLQRQQPNVPLLS